MNEKRKSAASYLVFIAIIIVLLFVVCFVIVPYFDSLKKEYPYSEDLKEFDKVYVDIKNLCPEFTLTNGTIIAVCLTTDGNKIYLYLSTNEYNSFEGASSQYSNGSAATSYSDIYYKNPVRIHGIIRNTEKLIKGNSMGIDRVIVYNSKD